MTSRRRRLRDELWRRRVSAQTERTLLPPLPEHFAGFGERSYILPPVRIHNPRYMEIGEEVAIWETGFLSAEPAGDGTEPRLVIGDRTHISAGITLAVVGTVRIGADCLISAHCFIGDASHAYEDVTRPINEQGMSPGRGVVIGDGSFIGINAVVLPGARLGRGVVVGAGSVVGAGTVDDHCVLVGNPARVVRRHVEGRGWVDVPSS